ncbi:MAG: aromatic amino acid lyase [Myxococcales bacterium]|nr:aromatic amino acid lyase [Myxococcales bacterium]
MRESFSNHEIVIDGLSLSIEDVVDVSRRRATVSLSNEARRRMERCRAVVDRLVESGTKVYGLTTGFGSKRDVFIDPQEARELQRNLIMSHACGVGAPLDEDQARATMLLRANTLARGVSGVRVEVVDLLLLMLNKGVYPYIPCKGSLGASGDLAPLSHLALVLMGHPAGKLYSKRCESINSRGYRTVEDPHVDLFISSTADVLRGQFGIEPIELMAKEGLALNNGTQMMTAIGSLTLYDSELLVRTAEVTCAAAVEALKGVTDAFSERLHDVRPFDGQRASAANLRTLLEGSDILALPLNMAWFTRARRLVEQALLYAVDSGSSNFDAIRRELQEIVEMMLAIHGDPVDAMRRGADQIPTSVRADLMPRQVQLRAFQIALAPILKRAQAVYREMLSVEHEEQLARSRESIAQVLDALEKAVPKSPRVQDDYSLRCMPQVAGAVRQVLAHVRVNLTTELNSATDNPLIFPPILPDSVDIETYRSLLTVPQCVDAVSSGGNFHGEMVAFLMDYLAVGIAEIGNISERRVAHLTDGHLNNGLPSLLIWRSGLNNGFMIPQYTAASLVSENKVLTHPASVDSIPSCENTEDHVSMGAIAARKARSILINVEHVVAIELLTCFQALCFREPFRPGPAIRAVMQHLRDAGVTPVEVDRPLYPDMDRVVRLLRRGEIVVAAENTVGPLTR